MDRSGFTPSSPPTFAYFRRAPIGVYLTNRIAAIPATSMSVPLRHARITSGAMARSSLSAAETEGRFEMAKEFVERRQGSFYLIGSRVPLGVIVHDFKNGDAPETILSNFPTLSIEQVYGAITFYLGNKEEVEKDLIERHQIEDEFIRTHPNPPGLEQKLLARR